MFPAIDNDRITRRLLPALCGLLVVTLVGCSSGASDAGEPSTGDEPSTSEGAEASEQSGDGADSEAAAQLGTITVGTTTYTVVESINCEPAGESDLFNETFSAIAGAQSFDGEEALFFAYTLEQAGVNSNFVDYQGPEGTWSTQDGDATLTVNDGRLNGAGLILNDDASESMMIQFNFTLPDELVEC